MTVHDLNAVHTEQLGTILDSNGNQVTGIKVIIATVTVDGEPVTSDVFGDWDAANRWEARQHDEYDGQLNEDTGDEAEVDVEFVTSVLNLGL